MVKFFPKVFAPSSEPSTALDWAMAVISPLSNDLFLEEPTMKRRDTVFERLSAQCQKACPSLVGVMLTSLIVACGAEPDSRFGSDDANGFRGRDKVVKPPRAYYDSLLADRMQLANSGMLQKPQDPILWLNFAGATVSKGYDSGQSFLPCKNSATIPQSQLSFNSQQEIANMVAGHFSNAGAKVEVTTEQPASGDYTTIHVGGDYGSLGCASSANPAGLAPFDVGNANPSDIGFVFPQSNDLESLARTIAHEAGHTYGLDHSTDPSNLMYPWDLQSAVGFATSVAGSNGATIDPATILQSVLGSGVSTVAGIPVSPTLPIPTVNLPQVNIPSLPSLPGQLAGLPGLANFANLNAIVGSMPAAVSGLIGCVVPAISVNGMPINVALQNTQGALGLLTVLMNASMGQNGGQFSMLQLVGLISGYPTMNIAQIISLAGISLSATQCLTQLVPVSIPGITANLPGQLPSGINIAQILALTNINNPGQLISLIPQYAQVIGLSSQGPNAQALMTLVLMAVAQQYSTIP